VKLGDIAGHDSLEMVAGGTPMGGFMAAVATPVYKNGVDTRSNAGPVKKAVQQYYQFRDGINESQLNGYMDHYQPVMATRDQVDIIYVTEPKEPKPALTKPLPLQDDREKLIHTDGVLTTVTPHETPDGPAVSTDIQMPYRMSQKAYNQRTRDELAKDLRNIEDPNVTGAVLILTPEGKMLTTAATAHATAYEIGGLSLGRAIPTVASNAQRESERPHVYLVLSDKKRMDPKTEERLGRKWRVTGTIAESDLAGTMKVIGKAQSERRVELIRPKA